MTIYYEHLNLYIKWNRFVLGGSVVTGCMSRFVQSGSECMPQFILSGSVCMSRFVLGGSVCMSRFVQGGSVDCGMHVPRKGVKQGNKDHHSLGEGLHGHGEAREGLWWWWQSSERA